MKKILFIMLSVIITLQPSLSFSSNYYSNNSGGSIYRNSSSGSIYRNTTNRSIYNNRTTTPIFRRTSTRPLFRGITRPRPLFRGITRPLFRSSGSRRLFNYSSSRGSSRNNNYKRPGTGYYHNPYPSSPTNAQLKKLANAIYDENLRRNVKAPTGNYPRRAYMQNK